MQARPLTGQFSTGDATQTDTRFQDLHGYSSRIHSN